MSRGSGVDTAEADGERLLRLGRGDASLAGAVLRAGGTELDARDGGSTLGDAELRCRFTRAGTPVVSGLRLSDGWDAGVPSRATMCTDPLGPALGPGVLAGVAAFFTATTRFVTVTVVVLFVGFEVLDLEKKERSEVAGRGAFIACTCGNAVAVGLLCTVVGPKSEWISQCVVYRGVRNAPNDGGLAQEPGWWWSDIKEQRRLWPLHSINLMGLI